MLLTERDLSAIGVVKLDAAGRIQWQRLMEGLPLTYNGDIRQLQDGSYALVTTVGSSGLVARGSRPRKRSPARPSGAKSSAPRPRGLALHPGDREAAMTSMAVSRDQNSS